MSKSVRFKSPARHEARMSSPASERMCGPGVRAMARAPLEGESREQLAGNREVEDKYEYKPRHVQGSSNK